MVCHFCNGEMQEPPCEECKGEGLVTRKVPRYKRIKALFTAPSAKVSNVFATERARAERERER
jgi:hypothetical protein